MYPLSTETKNMTLTITIRVVEMTLFVIQIIWMFCLIIHMLTNFSYVAFKAVLGICRTRCIYLRVVFISIHALHAHLGSSTQIYAKRFAF